jgi:hypothetical protein
MAGKYWRLLAALSLILLTPALLRGQGRVDDPDPKFPPKLPLRALSSDRPRLPDPSVFPPRSPLFQGATAFDHVVAAAGIIFAGRVISIRRVPLPTGEGPASTMITFQVDRGIRGILTGQNLTIHEWAGLWDRGERYRVGEHLMLFLYPPSKLGLTSPVAGAMGRFALDAKGRILMNQQHSESLNADPILGGKTAVPYADFRTAMRRSSREE